ncbi:hypothetical protein [Methylobacter tundripaludum]|uniref:Uncharacterized protein n=1 Tax=Methylobacter tundripaludum (strain ATCC BAA-1195 / DSM 17260 / SV96) TaxID=697282 RepID=G3J2D3_METTV|nr:hypothetical protein [Methylobacter tundripaludum]EGW19889.1 hypothetical protein Mettu_3009 [Methylobacter tundripaludum SV96]
MDNPAILDTLQAAHNKYFRLLLEHYPLISKDGLFVDFGPPELCDLAIEVHACAIALGPKALERLFYLGLDVLYPFDNPVDLYNWRIRVKKESIDHTTYASIAIRIDSELKRMRRVFELDGEAVYEVIPAEAFLVSKARYKSIAVPEEGNGGASQSGSGISSPSMHIDTVNIQYAADSQAVSRLEKLEKETTIGANFSNIISVLRTIFGG